MKDYKKLTDDFKNAFIKSVNTKEMVEMISKVKDASNDDSGTFEVIISTADQDRQGEVVDQNGWDLSFYMLNPVVLFAHDYQSLPVGVCTNIRTEGGKTIAQGKFAPADANPMGQQIRRLYDLGMIRTVSVGFIPKEFDPNDNGRILKAELLEFSFVPVPANPYALSLSQVKKSNIDVAFLMTKGFSFNLKEKETEEKGMDPKAVLMKAVEVYKDACMKEYSMHNDIHAKAVEVFKEVVKGIEIAKSEGDAFDNCFKEYSEKVALENQRHSKDMDMQCGILLKCMKDYVDGSMSGEDVGDNATADSVRMVKMVAEAMKHIESASNALKGIVDSSGGKKDGEPDDVTPPADPQKPADTTDGSKPLDDATKELSAFLTTRECLRAIDIAVGQALKNINQRDKANGKK